jgi:G:T-mismatch repair DNA endonuclease (very short patch repair protein)
MSDKIKCRLCDDSHGIKQFGMHVTRKHNIAYQEYAQKYWKDLPKWSPCKECGTICKDTYCTKDCFKIGQSKTLKGGKMPPRTKEHCKKISEAAKERLKDKTKHSRYGVTLTKETKKKISKSQKKRLEENGHWATGTHLSDETKQKISETRIELGHGVGDKNGMYGKTHTPEAIRKIFEHRKMNKLEKKVADYLDSKNVDYTFQFFINEDGVCKSYDFKWNNIILEVHGDYWHGGKGVKKHVHNVEEIQENDILKKEMAESRGYTVITVWEHEINNNIKLINKYIKL